ncbi:MAG: nicotinate-nucleotide adenylyltransferase [Dehalococcoidia bacterium]|nr:nicotinate-nucleotide adenylyltransferase [Dehalococcoidia bacterium]
MRVGILGGTFDPIHVGHLLIAEDARVSMELEEVLFIPTGQPWMKSGRALSPAHHRMNMVRMAIASNPFFRASSMEIERPGPTYTVDTLREMRHELGGEDDLYFILGSDSSDEFHRWKEPEEVLRLCTIVTMPRPGSLKHGLSAIDQSGSGNVVLLEGPLMDISGTEIRRRVSLGLSVRYLVPHEVEHYIRRYGLYGDREMG